MKTTFFNNIDGSKRKWWIVDAQGKVLGRLASTIAKILTGKHKKEYTPSEDMGDYVIVINAEKVVLSGKKWQNKIYRWHSGYIGGLKEYSAYELYKKDPRRLIYIAVKGMLPKNRTRKRRLKRLRIFIGPEHIHRAQEPKILEIKEDYKI
ncbi:MAG: 50S ribosomal protein L13 [candidate division WOR-3 bacterium]|nr:50S ribosomal protein L13 [candidate division WOR-3 bacterium]MCX7947270.1 50S ribosomal protein L13 [candidate division WOR-3 bacterium]MDW8150173.1 50S ribosomal protein L13 [candidate division WOR-3 bacterium]